MKYSSEHWQEKRRKGLGRFLLVDGILLTGGPFAVVLQIVGFFLTWGEYPSFSAYFTASRTWLTFLLQGVLFGLIIGYVNWRRNEKSHAEYAKSEDGV